MLYYSAGRGNHIKRVAVIQDISGLGRCSLAAALPVLSVMGMHCCPVPTAVLTNQTGFPRYASLDCGAMLRELPALWKENKVALDGIYAGFMSSQQQFDAAQAVIDAFRRPDTLLLIDPVMGDNGSRYPCFDAAFCDKIRTFSAQADILTPNVTEACLLAQADYEAFIKGTVQQQERALREICEALPARAVVVTGWRKNGMICNAAWQDGAFKCYESPAEKGSYSGTGDLFASVLCGGLLRGEGLEQSILLGMRFLEAALRDAVHEGLPEAEGVPFERHLKELLA